MYSHDTYGLGHIRRSMALAQNILAEEHNILILTGSPIVGRFDFPHGIDFVRIPGMIKQNNDLYVPLSIKVEPEMALAIRQNIILATAKAFKPSLFLVDKAPLGLKREVVSTLRWLREESPRTHVVLGLRDIMDSPESTIAEWRRKNIYDVLDTLYSEIWVYGSREVYDPVREYEIPAHIASKIHFTGYIPRQIPRIQHRPRLRRGMNIAPGEKFVLVTAGGGGDGYKVVDSYLTMLETLPHPPFKSMIVTGPMLAENLYDQLAARARKLKVRICKFYRKMEKAILAADCVVSMGGYNTMCEIVGAARPSLIIPRSVPREEQLIRARLFAARGLLEYIPWETVEPAPMLAHIEKLLHEPAPYEAALAGFPMTAFDIINQRIQSFGAQA
ncbi:MAG: glycosyltransferase [Proteobacteria bacterium]|nr:glycosyltransferase [Pseudomonadota bacterium]MBU4571096.1 glycosyltransferase [Pseudomonadota bacterium]MBU4593725.1 glycosyltransferase [Pseudomonadota bacterium]